MRPIFFKTCGFAHQVPAGVEFAFSIRGGICEEDIYEKDIDTSVVRWYNVYHVKNCIHKERT